MNQGWDDQSEHRTRPWNSIRHRPGRLGGRQVRRPDRCQLGPLRRPAAAVPAPLAPVETAQHASWEPALNPFAGWSPATRPRTDGLAPDAGRLARLLDRFNQGGLGQPGIGRLPGLPPSHASEPLLDGARYITRAFSNRAGSRAYKLYVRANPPRTRVKKSTLVAAVRRAWRARSASIRPATGARAASTELSDTWAIATARPAAPRRAPVRIAAEVPGEAGLARAASHRGASRSLPRGRRGGRRRCGRAP
jgi:hypothetical protein